MDKTHWLVRTKEMMISRPLSQDELIKKIEKGDLGPLDEICPGTGYWFGLHEVEEVRQHLGNIDLSNLSSGIEIEITTSTETTLKKTLILDLPKSWTHDPDKKSILTPANYTLTEVPNDAITAAGTLANKPKVRPVHVEQERHWIPAIIFGALFALVLIFLWMYSD